MLGMFVRIYFLLAAIAHAAIIAVNQANKTFTNTLTSINFTPTSLPASITSTSASDSSITPLAQLSNAQTTTDDWNACPIVAAQERLLVIQRPGSTIAFVTLGEEGVNPYTATDSASNATLQSFCSSAFEKSLSDWTSTVPLTGWMTKIATTQTVPPRTSFYVWEHCIKHTNIISSDIMLQTWSDTVTFTDQAVTGYQPASFFSYTATAPCCDKCHIFGGDVQVYFWPSSTISSLDSILTQSIVTSPVSILTNSAGFTFVSPSIYVAFRSLYASDRCGAVDLHHTPTTIAFRENELSTAIGYYWNTTAYKTFPPYFGSTRVFTAATFGSEACQGVTESFWQRAYAGIQGVYTNTYKDLSAIKTALGDQDFSQEWALGWMHEYTVTYDPCSPTISVPTQLFSVDSLWSSCGNDLTGLYDPPFTLSQGSGLEPISATVLPPVSTSADAETISPAATPTPATPIMTAIPTLKPSLKPATSVSENDIPAKTASSPATNDLTAIQDPPSPFNDNPTTPHDDFTFASNDPATTQDPSTPTTTPPLTYSVTAIIIGTQTVLPGGSEVVISGTSISLQPGASSIIINGNTAPLSFALLPSSYGFIIESQTLVPGGAAITVSGTTISLESGGASVVVGSTTQAISSFLGHTTVTASFVGIGGIVASIGGFVDESSSPTISTVDGQAGNESYNGPVFLGGVESWRKIDGVWRWLVVVGVGWVII